MSASISDNKNAVILDLGGGITVRELRDSDIKRYVHHADNINVWLNLRDRFPHPYTEEEAVKWLEMNKNPENHVRTGNWTAKGGTEGPAITPFYAVAVDDEAVGGIGLDFGRDVYFRTAELGYWLSEEHWGKGIMSKVTPAFVKWTWETFGILIRLNAEVVEGNQGSVKSLEKAGFVYEGRRQNATVKVGKVQSVLFYGLLRPE